MTSDFKKTSIPCQETFWQSQEGCANFGIPEEDTVFSSLEKPLSLCYETRAVSKWHIFPRSKCAKWHRSHSPDENFPIDPCVLNTEKTVLGRDFLQSRAA